MANLHDFNMKDIDGNERSLAEYKGNVVLVVNVASKCGLTPQYEGLQRLYDEFQPQGLEILACPCNQFLEQEPGTDAEIREFCTLNYSVNFPLYSKIEVNGDNRCDLYGWLTTSDAGPEEAGDIKWNFGKFLIDKNGEVVKRFSPQVEPCAQEVKDAISTAL
jgi:glutathione peroxidase